MITLYGIPNCDSVKKARQWLDKNNVEYFFHNYKKDGIDEANLTLWCNEFGFDKVLNKRGTTWRKLQDSEKSNLTEPKAIKIMQEHTSSIKRPILKSSKSSSDNEYILGFEESQYKSLL